MSRHERSFRRVVAAALGIAVLGTAVGAAAATSTPQVTSNHRLAPVGDAAAARAREIPGLVVDPANPRHIVEVDEDFLGGQCDAHVTFDGGQHWTGGHLRAPAGFPERPCVQFDFGGYAHSNGSVVWGSGQNVYTTFSSARPNESESILVARSTDGGRTFAPATVAIAGTPSDRPVVTDRPKLAVAPRAGGDHVYLVAIGCDTVAIQGGGACQRTAFAASADGGQTWRASRSIASPTEGVTSASSQPAIGPDGTVYVAMRRGVVASLPRNLFLASTKDDGATWKFEEIGTVNTPADLKLVADRQGALYLALGTLQFSGDSDNSDVAVLHRAAGSTTWSAPVRVNDDPPGKKVTQRLPWLSVSAAGRLELLWHDRRHPYPDQLMEDYYYAASDDGGVTFTPNRRITDRTKNLSIGLNRRVSGGFYWPALVSLGGGRSLAAWADSREGNYDNDNEDIYLAELAPTRGALPVQRISAPTAADRSVALSRLAHPGGQEVNGGKPVTKVVIARDGDLTGLLAGAVLGRSTLGPVLVSTGTGLTRAVQTEVRRLQATGAFIVGTESQLGSGVLRDLAQAGVPADKITRLAGRDPADTARLVAMALDSRSSDARSAGTPAAPEAVIVNPQSPEAAAAGALAASLRLPVLVVGRDVVPGATKEALAALNIPATIVIGSPSVVSDAVLAALPKPTRLAGSDASTTAAAVAAEAKSRGLPDNIIYLGNAASPADGALLAGVVARRGGLMLLTAGASTAAAERQLRQQGLRARADRFVVLGAGTTAATRTPTKAPSAQIAPATAQLPRTGGGESAAAGMVLLAVALAGRRARRSS